MSALLGFRVDDAENFPETVNAHRLNVYLATILYAYFATRERVLRWW